MRPLDKFQSIFFSAEFLYLGNIFFCICRNNRFHGPHTSHTKSRCNLLCYFLVTNWIFFPDQSTEILTTVLEDRLWKELERFVRRNINIPKSLWCEEDKLVRSNTNYVAIFSQSGFNSPRVSSREPGNCKIFSLKLVCMVQIQDEKCLWIDLPMVSIPYIEIAACLELGK
jgi:hypothetical protein